MEAHSRPARKGGADHLRPTCTLPDRLLSLCFQHIDCKERMRSASLVCKKWHALCLRCPDLEVSLTSHGDPLLAKLRSLAAWLVVAGGHHLRCLAVDLHMAGLELDGHSAAEAEALLGTCCSACPGVEVLALTANIPLLLTSWLAGLRHLRCLRLASTQEVQLMWSLQGHTSLRKLQLSGSKVEWHPDVHLPSTLTSLHLGDAGSYRLPVAQLAALSGLQRLVLSALRCPSGEFAALAGLSKLTRLHLLGYAFVPESIGALTWLQELRYESRFEDADFMEETSAALQVALPRMSQLTCLVLSSAALDQEVMWSVASLPSLRRLYASAEWALLPAGPWQRHLRWLALGHCALLASLAEMAAAPCLEYVNCLSVPDCKSFAEQREVWERLWRWAETHPPLQRLVFDGCKDTVVPAGLLAGALRLQRHRPALAMLCSGCGCEGAPPCRLEFIEADEEAH